MTDYRAPKWLPGAHAQTIYPLLIKPQPYPHFCERWETPDDDFIDLDWNATSARPNFAAEAPLVVLFHGLEGNSNSHYALSLMHALDAVGWGGVVVHFRGCSGEPNRLPRAYHSGDSEEIDWVLRRIRQAHTNRPLYAAGVSLGGNALLKWLGERESAAGELLQAAAGISAPLDLVACGHNLAHGFNRVYTRHFLQTLIPNAAAKLERFPGIFDGQRLRRARTVFEFDDIVTAPLHGFRGTDDYWARASAKPHLARIRMAALVVNALNDPFVPAASLPRPHEVGRHVTLWQPAHGGHVGFPAGRFPGHVQSMPEAVLGWLAERL